MSPPLVFATPSYAELGRRIVAAGALEAGELESSTFPDGERYFRVRSPVAEREVVLVGGTVSDADTLTIYDLACGLVAEGARRLTLVIPYYGYSTMERAAQPGEVVTAKTRARLLSSVPPAAAGNRAVFLDLHSEGLPYYLEAGLVPVHVSARPVVVTVARERGGEGFVLGCADAGRAKWVQSMALELSVPPAFVFKRRAADGRTEVTAVSAQVERRRVILYDDMVRTGGSLLGAARAYLDAGAASVTAVTTHGVLPGDALERLRASGLLEGLVTTDSHPRALALEGGFLTVVSVAGLLAGAIGPATA